MERSSIQKMKLGIFVIIGSALLIVTAYFIGNRQNMFSSNIEITAMFKNVNGLQKGNNVRFSGINIGTVDDILMLNDTTIKVKMLIDESMLAHLRKDAIASVGSDGLVGSMIVNITPGKGLSEMVESGDEIRSFSRIATEDMLKTLNVTNENAALLTADLLTLTQALIEGEGTLGRLIFDDEMAQNFNESIINLKKVSENANNTMIELNTFFKSESMENSPAGVILKDSVSGEKVKELIANLEKTSIEIDTMVTELKYLIMDIKEGEGAINYLTQDSVFVHRMDSTMENIEQGSARFNENMEAMRSNFLFRSYFKSIEKEEKKAEKKKNKNK